MLMEKGFVENGFIIDLSNAKDTAQLVHELSSIMEHPDVKGKNLCLKLGNTDLKQSQLLSIKALIETMGAFIAFVDTTSEQTEASAVSLGVMVSKLGDNTEDVASLGIEEQSENENIDNTTVEIVADTQISSNIETTEGIEDVYDEVSTEELSEIIPTENYDRTDLEL